MNLDALSAIGGGLISPIADFASQQLTNQQNMSITRQQWDRDDNAIQRRVADLKAAGLSPVLAAGQGAGNSSPITMGATKTGDYGGTAASIYRSLQQSKTEAAMRDANLKIAQEQAKNLTQQRGLLAAQTVDTMGRSGQNWHDLNYWQKTGVASGAGNGIVSQFNQGIESAKTRLGQLAPVVEQAKEEIKKVLPESYVNPDKPADKGFLLPIPKKWSDYLKESLQKIKDRQAEAELEARRKRR